MFKVYRLGGKSLFLPLLLILPLVFFVGLPLLLIGLVVGTALLFRRWRDRLPVAWRATGLRCVASIRDLSRLFLDLYSGAVPGGGAAGQLVAAGCPADCLDF